MPWLRSCSSLLPALLLSLSLSRPASAAQDPFDLCSRPDKRVGRKAWIDGPANLRASPSAGAALEWTAEDGQRVRVLGYESGWFQIEGSARGLDRVGGWTQASNLKTTVCQIYDATPPPQPPPPPGAPARFGSPRTYEDSLPRNSDGAPAVFLKFDAAEFRLQAFGRQSRLLLTQYCDHYLFATADPKYPFGYVVEGGAPGGIVVFGPTGIRTYSEPASEPPAIVHTHVVTILPDRRLKVGQESACMELTAVLSLRNGSFGILEAAFYPRYQHQSIKKPLSGVCVMRELGSGASRRLKPGERVELLGLCARGKTAHIKRVSDGVGRLCREHGGRSLLLGERGLCGLKEGGQASPPG